MSKTRPSHQLRPATERAIVIFVTLIGLVVATGAAVRLLVIADWDPSTFLKVGEDAGPIIDYAEDRLGRVSLASSFGHDGKFFFIQANDPFYLDPDAHASLLDRPTYRAQRMLYPTVASAFGALGPAAIVWALPLVNVLAIAGGTWLTAELARRRGHSPWLGLFFSLNVGLLMELFIDGAGALAWALAVGAVLAIETGRLGWATAATCAAVLTREAMILVAIGLFVGIWLTQRRRLWQMIFLPAVLAACWWLYVSLRLPSGPAAQVQEIGIPFKGLAIAARYWIDRPFDLFVAVTVLLICIVFAVRALRGRDLLAWAAVGFVALLPLLSEQVLIHYFDVTRAVAPVLTAYPLLLAGSTRPPVGRDADLIAGDVVA